VRANDPSIAAAVIAKNEERNIAACLATLGWADEMVVLDSCSSDGTVAAARAAGATVHQRAFDDFAHHRNAALDLIKSDWVLFVDADERVSPALAQEARRLVAQAEAGWQAGTGRVAGYWVPRRNIILGNWIKGGGWFPDYQLRLLKLGRARYDEEHKVHEVVVLDGEAGHLAEPFLHYNYQTLGQIIAKQRAYVGLEAQSLLDRGARGRPHSIFLQPLREFWRRFVSLGGWRDGGHGLLLATVLALYNGVAYFKVWQLRRGDRRTGG
jgi:glycosyltransferase involved in cell wall biosynthesis